MPGSREPQLTSSVPQVLTLVGPTASGKTHLSLALAELLGGEIINADAMQVYRGMDIGTAKLPLAERRGIPHHLLDVWDIHEPANVADFQRLARAAITDIRSRGNVPIIVGGSGLYVRAILDDLDFPTTDATLRARLLQELADVGAETLHARLACHDPEAAIAILPTNGRRIVRALEVVELTGRPFAASLPVPRPVVRSLTIGLDIARDSVDSRIAHRVDVMWTAGLVAEVHHLREHGLDSAPTARQALGYAQILQALTAGENPDSAREPTKAATRRFARRQLSWFRRDADTVWCDVSNPDLVAHIATLWENSQIAQTA